MIFSLKYIFMKIKDLLHKINCKIHIMLIVRKPI